MGMALLSVCLKTFSIYHGNDSTSARQTCKCSVKGGLICPRGKLQSVKVSSQWTNGPCTLCPGSSKVLPWPRVLTHLFHAHYQLFSLSRLTPSPCLSLPLPASWLPHKLPTSKSLSQVLLWENPTKTASDFSVLGFAFCLLLSELQISHPKESIIIRAPFTMC